ncbi:MAG: hypothetical protein JWN82_348 [Candidatus Saccharibacteria bacterium]|nr:hypothetical protein [Candidatus Saccharibacteria bacterium]
MSGNFTTRMREGLRHNAIASLVMSCLAAFFLVAVTPSMGEAEASSCSAITLHGRAISSGGKALKRYGIIVTLHGKEKPLDGMRTSKRGGYSLQVCRTGGLSTYAKRHGGRVNFDLLAHVYDQRGKFFVRMVGVNYKASRQLVPSRFTPAKVYDGTLSARPSSRQGGGTVATGVANTAVSVVTPPLMYSQAVLHMTTHYTLNAASVRNVKAIVGLEKGGFGGAGEIAIGGSTGFESGRQLNATKRHPRVARLIAPELAVSSAYKCTAQSYNSYFGSYLGTGEQKCFTESSGQWTGDIKTLNTGYKPCTTGNSNVMYFTNKQQDHITTSQGVTFSSSVKASALGSSLTVSAKYDTGTEVRLEFDKGHKHKFCLSGDAQFVSDSAKLYPSFIKPHHGDMSGCYPRSEHRTKRCRQAP